MLPSDVPIIRKQYIPSRRVDISDNSTVRLERGFTSRTAMSGGQEDDAIQQAQILEAVEAAMPGVPSMTFLSVEELMKRYKQADPEAMKSLVGAIRNEDTGAIYRLEMDRGLYLLRCKFSTHHVCSQPA